MSAGYRPQIVDKEFAISYVETPVVSLEPTDAPMYLSVLAKENRSDKWKKVHGWLKSNTHVLTKNDDILCLALNIYHEARGSTLEDKIAVSEVVLNRAMSEKWPNGICDVVWQRNQFSWTVDSLTDRVHEKEAWIRAQTIAEMIYKGYTHNLLDDQDHYHANYVQPYWSSYGEEVVSLGEHIYMKVSL